MSHETHHHDYHHEDGVRRPRQGRGRGRFPGGPFGSADEMFRGARRGRRLRRGDVRAAVLVLLEESPRNGYQIIQELSERSNGTWRPSPGSVYPILQQLEDEGLIEVASIESGRSFSLTAKGAKLVVDERDSLGRPWETAAAEESDTTSELFGTMKQVIMAARQVAFAGTEAQSQQAVTVLADARRSIYRILAEDET